MRMSKEERDDLRARCRAGVIAITTDAALVAALLDDVEDADANLASARAAESRLFAETHAEIAALGAEVDRLRGERDARPEITAEEAKAFVWYHHGPGVYLTHERHTAGNVMAALRAHAGKVAR